MRQYWIRLTFSDPTRKTSPSPVVCVDDAGTIEAARAGRSVERTLYRGSDDEVIEAAKRWLRLHRRATQQRVHFDRWVVIACHNNTGLPQVVATGGPTDT